MLSCRCIALSALKRMPDLSRCFPWVMLANPLGHWNRQSDAAELLQHALPGLRVPRLRGDGRHGDVCKEPCVSWTRALRWALCFWPYEQVPTRFKIVLTSGTPRIRFKVGDPGRYNKDSKPIDHVLSEIPVPVFVTDDMLEVSLPSQATAVVTHFGAYCPVWGHHPSVLRGEKNAWGMQMMAQRPFVPTHQQLASTLSTCSYLVLCKDTQAASCLPSDLAVLVHRRPYGLM